MPRLPRFLLLCLLALSLMALPACSTPATNISSDSGQSLGPTIAIDSQGNLHLAWFDDSQGVFDIYYASKPSQGAWSSPVNISRSSSYSRAPSIAVDSHDTVHLVWYDHSPGNEDIFYSMKPQGGAWSQPVDLTNSPNDSSFPYLYIDRNDTLHLVYYETTADGEDIFYMDKPSGGDWSKPVNISNNPGNSRNPVVVSESDGTLDLVWDDNVSSISDIFWSTKPPGGEWSAPANISQTPGNSEFPRIAIGADDTLHVVWYDNSRGAWDIDYVSKVKGQDWSPVTNITSGDNGDSGFPRIAVDGNGVHLVWNYRPAGDKTTYDILYSIKKGGAGWSAPVDVSKSKANAGDPDIALGSGGKASIVWSDESPGNWDILYATRDK